MIMTENMNTDKGDIAMKHVVIVSRPDAEGFGKIIEAELSEGRKAYLAEAEYTQEELAQFDAEKMKWILQCRGSHCFLAESDSGEDADGWYCEYFDLIPEKAVFMDGELAGLFICNDGIRYSGRGRYNFEIDDWGYPGQDPFGFTRAGSGTHVFLFDDEQTWSWKDWSLLVRDPDAEYEGYLDF